MKKYLTCFLVILLFGCSTPIDTQTTQIDTETQNPKVILALGDSLTAGYGLPIDDSYPSQLEKKLILNEYNYRVVNAGISGDTTAGLLSRLDWVLEGELPSLVILCIGANDAFQGKKVEDIETNLRTIIEKIQTKNIPILFAGMKAPLNLGGAYTKEYESMFPRLAKEYNLSFMNFFLEGVALKASLNLDDRIHPNRAGYAIVVENLIEILEKENLVTK